MVDWHLARQIAVDTWFVTVLVCAIAWVVAGITGLVIRKTAKTATDSKESSEKG